MPAEGQIASEIESDGQRLVIRYLASGDAPALLTYINTLSLEQTFILFQGEQLTLAQEEAWLQERLAGLEAGDDVTLMAESNGEVVGIAGATRKPLVERHIAVLGLSVAAEFRGRGVGTILFRTLIAEAIANLPGIRLLELSVFGTNKRAEALYHREGFVEHGRLPGGVFHRGEYIDHVFMHRDVRTAT